MINAFPFLEFCCAYLIENISLAISRNASSVVLSKIYSKNKSTILKFGYSYELQGDLPPFWIYNYSKPYTCDVSSQVIIEFLDY